MTGSSGGYLERPAPSGLADVVEVILDKGIVIDAYVRVSVVGIELLTVDARIVVSSVDTYLRFAEATSRLDLYPEGGMTLPEFVEEVGGGAVEKVASNVAEKKVDDVAQKAGRAARKVVPASVADSPIFRTCRRPRRGSPSRTARPSRPSPRAWPEPVTMGPSVSGRGAAAPPRPRG